MARHSRIAAGLLYMASCIMLIASLTGAASVKQAPSHQLIITTNPYQGQYGPPDCTWYAWQRLHDTEGIDLQFTDNAANWINRVQGQNAAWSERSQSYVQVEVTTTPQAGDLVVFPYVDGYWAYTSAGHVAYVESVSGPTITISQQSYEDYGPGSNTQPYPWTRTFSLNVATMQQRQQGHARFIKFVNSGASSQPPAASFDGDSVIDQSTNVTTTSDGTVALHFTLLNTGSTTWTQSAGYSLKEMFGYCQTCSAMTVALGSATIAPQQQYTFMFNLSVGPGNFCALGSASCPDAVTWDTQWSMVHGSYQFGSPMSVAISVSGVTNASTPPPSATATPPQTTGLSCSAPTLSSPGNGAYYAQSQSITLSWSTNCAQSYAELTGGPYGTLNFGGWMSGSSVYVGQMWPGSYTWHVQGKDSYGNQTGWSASWSFTITSNPTPTPTNAPPPTPTTAPPTPTNPPSLSCSTPSLSGPGNGASYPQSQSITISWNTNCSQSYAELWGGPYGTLNFGGWMTNNYVVIGQMWPGTYTWHVQGMDASGNLTSWSSQWTFTITSNPTPTPTPQPSGGGCTPSLINPPNGASYSQSQSITLQWSTSCPQSYVELWGGPYSTLNFGGWMTNNYVVIGQMWPGTYTWHVKAMDSSGNQTGWSQSFTFTIQ